MTHFYVHIHLMPNILFSHETNNDETTILFVDLCENCDDFVSKKLYMQKNSILQNFSHFKKNNFYKKITTK